MAEYVRWAAASGSPDELAETGLLLLDLMAGPLGVPDPRDLTPPDLRRLLLTCFPREVATIDIEDAVRAVPAAREIVRFAAESIAPKRADALSAVLDEAEPHFLGAVSGALRRGRALVRAMIEAGVDTDDEKAVRLFAAGYNAGAGGDSEPDDDDDPDEPDPAEVRELFGLPERLPAVRLPDEAGLAELARGTRLLGRAVELARWADGRPLTRAGLLRARDAAAAAAKLGIEVPDGEPAVAAPGLSLLWDLIWCAGLAAESADGSRAEADGDVARWPGWDDDDVLGLWAEAHAHVLAHVLEAEDPAGEFHDLALCAAGQGLSIGLLAAGAQGLDRDDCGLLLRDLATGELEPPDARRRWRQWTAAHGDPADTLIGLLAELGAVEADAGTVRLAPLGWWDMRDSMAEIVEIPLLPPAGEMTAADLVAFARTAGPEELAAEQRAWLAARPGADAARQLLALAGSGDTAVRVIAAGIAGEIGAPAEPAWREVAGSPPLRPYALVALARIADPAAGETAPVPGMGPAEVAWLAADTVVAMTSGAGPDELAELVGDAIPVPGSLAAVTELLEQIGRSDSPAAAEALTLIGRHHPDRQVAKAARKAAFRAASARPAAARSRRR